MTTDWRQVSKEELTSLLPEVFKDLQSRHIPLVSRYGWKVIQLDGEKCLAPCDEGNYRRFLEAVFPPDQVEPRLGDPCYTSDSGGCMGSTPDCYCHLWWSKQWQAYVCGCGSDS